MPCKADFGFDFGRQIICDQRKKSLIAFLNHLEIAPVSNWSQMHAQGEIKKEKKRYSKIKVIAQDYSKGTGQNSFFCSFNFDPADIKNLKNIVDLRYNEYQRKFFKVVKQNGPSTFSQVIISRNPQMNNPWAIEVSNGNTIDSRPIQNSIKKITQRFTEDGFFDLITTVFTFLNLWEQKFVTQLIEAGHKQSRPLIEENTKLINNSNSGYNNNNKNGYAPQEGFGY